MGTNMAHFIWWKDTCKLKNLLYDIDLNCLLQDEQERIRMETLCSFLLGPHGNSGYGFVGRVENQSLEDQKLSGELLIACEYVRLNVFLSVWPFSKTIERKTR